MFITLLLAVAGELPNDQFRLPDPADGPRLACVLLLDAPIDTISCITIPAPAEKPVRPRKNPFYGDNGNG